MTSWMLFQDFKWMLTVQIWIYSLLHIHSIGSKRYRVGHKTQITICFLIGCGQWKRQMTKEMFIKHKAYEMAKVIWRKIHTEKLEGVLLVSVQEGCVMTFEKWLKRGGWEWKSNKYLGSESGRQTVMTFSNPTKEQEDSYIVRLEEKTWLQVAAF